MKKTSTQKESTKKETQGLFSLDSLAYESKSKTGWKRCIVNVSYSWFYFPVKLMSFSLFFNFAFYH